VPLVAGGDIYGALDVGYPAGARVTLEEDERDLLPIANQLSVALRNAWLHGESELLRDYLAKLVDHADALIVGIDRQFRLTVFNQALSQLLGWPAQLVVGRDVRDWLPEPERARFTGLVLDALAGRSSRAFDLELRTRSGEPVRTLWNVAALGAEGTADTVVAVGQDVTRLRSLERQIIQAEKLATLGQLAAGVVHELNNPLTSISVYADFLLKRLERGLPVEPGDVEKLRRIVEGAERIQNFARSLVQYAKPSPASPERINVADVVRQALSFCEHMIRKTDARLELVLDDALPPVFAVRGQLQQVVINLVTNALHALPGTAGQIAVKAFRHDHDNVALAVEDNGHGIRPEDRARIFEPFFTTKTDGRGTGLGLSIVRNIIDAHRGEIEVDSLPGRGTAFRVVLPRAPE
jgi:two-component system, NtrC family, sensor kinase